MLIVAVLLVSSIVGSSENQQMIETFKSFQYSISANVLEQEMLGDWKLEAVFSEGDRLTEFENQNVGICFKNYSFMNSDRSGSALWRCVGFDTKRNVFELFRHQGGYYGRAELIDSNLIIVDQLKSSSNNDSRECTPTRHNVYWKFVRSGTKPGTGSERR